MHKLAVELKQQLVPVVKSRYVRDLSAPAVSSAPYGPESTPPNAWFDEDSATGVVATLIVTALALYVQARLAPMAGCRGVVAGVARRLCGSRVR